LQDPLEFLKNDIAKRREEHPRVQANGNQVQVTVNQYFNMIAVPNTPFTVLFLEEKNYKI